MNDRSASVPEGAGPPEGGPGTGASRGGPPPAALIGLGVLAAVVAILLAVLLLRPQEPAGQASPSPSSSGAPPSVTAEPTAAASPSATADPTAEAPALPGSWTEAAVFSEAGKRYVLGDLVAWSNGLVAVGTLYEDANRSVFGPPPPRSGRVWHSTDGSDWADVTPDGTFADVELAHLYEAADGALIVIGQAYDNETAPESPVSAAWETRDGETWTSVALAGIPEGAFILDVAAGGRGHLAAVSTAAPAQAMFSTDGRSWEVAIDDFAVATVAAGDEGFVMSGLPAGPEGAPRQVMASADGHEWVDATEPEGDDFLAAPHGADWIASTTTIDPDAVSVANATWQSADGLDWSEAGEIPLEVSDVAGTGCHEIPTALHGLPTMAVSGTVLTFGCGEGAVVAAGGSYATLDGGEWTRLPFGEQAFAAGAAIIGDLVVVATDARTSSAEVVGVTFWVGAP
jgi:hypothetical protein